MDRYTASPPEGQAFSSGTCSWARDPVYYSKRLRNRSFPNQREWASPAGAAWMASYLLLIMKPQPDVSDRDAGN